MAIQSFTAVGPGVTPFCCYVNDAALNMYMS